MEDRDVRKCLAALGDNKKEVAESLKRLGIKGVRGTCSKCPIANFLVVNGIALNSVRKIGQGGSYCLTGNTEAVDILWGSGTIWTAQEQGYPEAKVLFLSGYSELDGVLDFIEAFDAGQFLELDEQQSQHKQQSWFQHLPSLFWWMK